MIVAGMVLVLAALLVTGTTYKEHGQVDSDIMVASVIALALGMILIIGGAKKPSE